MWGIYKKFEDCECLGVYATDIFNEDTLSSWFDIENLTGKIRRKIK
jgi:hypothetical protein